MYTLIILRVPYFMNPLFKRYLCTSILWKGIIFVLYYYSALKEEFLDQKLKPRRRYISLPTQILIALVLGVVVGYFLHGQDNLIKFIRPIGDIF